MALRVILHIGMPKTATSSLQRAFTGNRALLRTHGIAYPLPEQRRAIAQHDLIRSFISGDIAAVDAFFDAQLASLGDSDRILMSAEAMSGMDPDGLRRWKDYLDRRFGNPEFSVWMSVRRVSEWIPSAWQSHVRRGGCDTYPAFAFEALDRVLTANRFPFERIADLWLEVFGRGSLRIVPMDRLTGGGADLVVSTFKLLLDLEVPNLSGSYRYNAAMPAGETELVRNVSMRHALAGDTSGKKLSRVLSSHLRRSGSPASDMARLFDPWVSELTVPDRSEAMLQMERVAAARYAGPLERSDDELIFRNTPAEPAKYVRDAYRADPEIGRRLDEAYAWAIEWLRRQVSDEKP